MSGWSIVYTEGSHVISKGNLFCPWSLFSVRAISTKLDETPVYGISSGSSLFAKEPVLGFPVYNRLKWIIEHIYFCNRSALRLGLLHLF